MSKIVRQTLAEAAEALAAIGAGNPRFEAELLLAETTGRSRTHLFAYADEPVDAAARARFEALLERRLSGEPLQYILGTAPFRYLDLRVRPGVLIPRSETEILIEQALRSLERRGRAARSTRPATDSAWVIDVGVGSGAILLSLLKEADGRGMPMRPLGIDISSLALELTAQNAQRNGLPVPHLCLGDMLGAIDPEAEVALIVSNPPYVSTAEMADLPAEIREHEPHEALHGGRDGLAAICTLLDQARPFLARGTPLVFEIGGFQGAAVKALLAARGLLDHAAITADLAGRDRIVTIGHGANPSAGRAGGDTGERI